MGYTSTTHCHGSVMQILETKTTQAWGGPDALIYGNWIRKIKDLLEVMECPAQFKVWLAFHQFEKETNL